MDDDIIELSSSSESSQDISLSDEDSGYTPLVEEKEEQEKVEGAQVLSAKQIYEMMQSELKKVCDVTDVSILLISSGFAILNLLPILETTERSPPPSFAE